jgi:hypothetical protein
VTARYAYGCSRAGLRITAQTVYVRNPVRPLTIPVSEVARFGAGGQSTSGLGNPTPGIGLLKTDGTTVHVWTLVKEGFVWNARRNEQSFEPLAESLNSLLGRAPSHTADPTATVAV